MPARATIRQPEATDARGKGYGTETARLLLDDAFTALGLHSVYLTVAEYNLAGRRAYERAGFTGTGHRRQAWRMAGRFWDEIIMDCLSDEVSGIRRTRQQSLTPDT